MKVIVPNKLELLSCSLAESDAVDGAIWSAEATYAKDAKVRHNHVCYASLDKDNKGNNPANAWSGGEAKWKKIGATMPWKMLDEFVETQTRAAKGQKLSFAVPFDRADAFALFNMDAFQLKAKIYDLDDTPEELVWPDGEYLDEGWILTADISDFSLHEYNYSPIVCIPHKYFTDIPLQIHGRLEVELDAGDPEYQAGLGHIVAGRSHWLGWTQYSAELGFIDYSRKNTDEFGRTTLVRRSFASSMSLPIYIHPQRADYVYQTLASIRGIPCAWIGDNFDQGLRSMLIYGWLEDFRMVCEGPNEMRLALEIQGLI